MVMLPLIMMLLLLHRRRRHRHRRGHGRGHHRRQLRQMSWRRRGHPLSLSLNIGERNKRNLLLLKLLRRLMQSRGRRWPLRMRRGTRGGHIPSVMLRRLYRWKHLVGSAVSCRSCCWPRRRRRPATPQPLSGARAPAQILFRLLLEDGHDCRASVSVGTWLGATDDLTY